MNNKSAYQRPFSRSILLRDHPLRIHCHKVLPLDCLLTPLPSLPSWDPLNCLETGTRSFWTLSPRRLWIHRGFQKLLERVSRQFRRVLEGGGGRGLRDGSSERQGHFVSVPKSSRWAARTPPRVGVAAIWKQVAGTTLCCACGPGHCAADGRCPAGVGQWPMFAHPAQLCGTLQASGVFGVADSWRDSAVVTTHVPSLRPWAQRRLAR